MNIKNAIIQYSKKIGIDLIGFTTAEVFDDVEAKISLRLKRNHLTGFEEKDLEKRINPKKTMEEAESIIVIGQGYYHSYEENQSPKYYGELARTAWGRDYHVVLMEKLQQLGDFIKTQVNDFKYKPFVDTGPLVDREVAYRGGLGFFGYNSTLINKRYGSWFFIGYMITNLKLDADKPLKEVCEGCQLCIKNCPGQALDTGYSFNGKKCVSYVLQQREDIPENIWGILEKRIYGCDICQRVCPHNRLSAELTEKKFIPTDLPPKTDLIKLLNLSNKEFKRIFSNNAAGWRGKKILQRNAIIALVNYGDVRAIQYLIPLLKDSRYEIRKYALWGIFTLDKEIGKKEAEKLRLKESHPEIKKQMDDILNS